MTKVKYKRILLKISGEALMGTGNFGHDFQEINRICNDIKEAYKLGVEICLVVGGGNIFRGSTAAQAGFERVSADYMGMLATVINALSIQQCLEKIGVPTRVQSAIPMTTICEPYIRRRALRHIEKGIVVIFAAGTGNPFFTTDMSATLRAIEMNCNVLLKGTKVDGIYDSDPVTNKNAKRYTTLKYADVLNESLGIMDSSAIALAKENNIPILVFSIRDEGQLIEVLNGRGKYTEVIQ